MRRTIFDDFWSRGGDNVARRQLNSLKPVEYASAQLGSKITEYNTVLHYLTSTNTKKTPDRSIVKRCQRFNTQQEGTAHNKKKTDRRLGVRSVSFNPRVGVYRYLSILPPKISALKNSNLNESTNKSDTWYTAQELALFRLEASFIVRQNKTKFGCSEYNRKSLFAYPALKAIDGDRVFIERSCELKVLMMTHIRSVLIVEPHQIFLDIYVRSIKKMLPHVSISTAKDSVDAIKQVDKMSNLEKKDTIETKKRMNNFDMNNFDIIIVEERLRKQRMGCENKENISPNKPISGSDIIQRIISLDHFHRNKLSNENQISSSQYSPKSTILYNNDYVCTSNRIPLLIGTSSFLGEDCQKLTLSGADVLWGKPPPKMDEVLRNELLTALLRKRGLSDVVCG